MKKISTLLLTVLLLTLTTAVSAQQPAYHIHECSEHCGVIRFGEHRFEARTSLEAWTEPIRVSVGVQEGVVISDAEIAAQISEDSDIAIADGVYTGEGPAYMLANVFTFSPDDLTDEGLPFTVNAVSIAFSTINDQGVIGTIYDSIVLNNRICYGSHKTMLIVDNETPGIQELATINALPDTSRNPTEVFKRDAFMARNVRNHAITHSGGGNSGDHQDGPVVSRRPIQTNDGRSYGWSTTGTLGFSGGTALGVGSSGEDLAGHIADGHASWLSILPHLQATIVSSPTETTVGEMTTFEAEINKDIGNENWSWEFRNSTISQSATGNPVSISFDELGTWTYTAIVSNDCGGQSDTVTGTFEVDMESAVTNVHEDTRISVFPNPSYDLVNIMTDGSLSVKEVRLYDAGGRKVLQSRYSTEISLDHLPSGLYQMVIVTADEVFVTRLQKF